MKISKIIAVFLMLCITSTCFTQEKFEAKPNSEDLKNEVFIVTELNKTDITISDSVIVKYKLFVSHSTGINSWSEVSEPIYKDFEANKKELTQMNIAYEKHKGQKYRTVLLKEVTLKPNKTGNLELPEYVLNLTVETPSNPPKKVYDRPKLEKRDITITTDKINLTVK